MTARQPKYNHKLKVMTLALRADHEDAGPYAICQAHLILASFGERAAGVAQHGSGPQRRAFEEATLTWNVLRLVLDTIDQPVNYKTLVQTIAKIARKERAKWQSTIAIKGAEAQVKLEHDVYLKAMKKLTVE